jgi:EAL domain-containing protein (putative c-di-GMP-specific phosphodiesterase class I)
MQGFYFSRPREAAQIARLLDSEAVRPAKIA